mgnify:CR=1 FL=1
MKVKLLIICNDLPYPVRNGITAAINSFILRIKDDFEIYFLIKKSYYFLKSSNLIEVLEMSIDFKSFDIYVTSPIHPSIKNAFKIPRKSTKVALLSDCYTFVLWTNIKLAIKFNYISFFTFKDLLKIPFYYLLELMVSLKYNYVFLQTPRDVSIFSKLFFTKKVIALPNIVYNSFQSNNISLNKRKGIGWVASFEGSYKKIANYFFDESLVEVLLKDSCLKIYFLGKNSDNFVKEISLKYPLLKSQLIAEPFYDKIEDFYNKRRIIISPVFKNYGLINKTIESLAYGCITIGDRGSFNGIEGFVSGKHGFIAEGFKEFSKLIIEKNNNIDETISLNARHLIHNFNNNNLHSKLFKDVFRL